MTEKNTSIQKKSGRSTPKQAATTSNARKVSGFESSTVGVKPKTGKSQASRNSPKPKMSKKAEKFKKSTALHSFFQFIEKNFTLSTFLIVVSLILVAIFLLGIIAGFKIRSSLEDKRDIDTYIQRASEEFGVPYDIIYAVIKTESDFDPDAVSSSGARGLMQIMPKQTLDHINELMHTDYKPKDLFDPEINIRLGTRYLSYLYSEFGNYETVYAAYNAGYGYVKGWLADSQYSTDGKTLIHDNIPFPETKRYVEKVIAFREDYLASQE